MPNPVADFPWRWRQVIGDTQVLTGPGVLHTVVLNGLTVAGVAIIYDNVGVGAAATIIGTYDFTPAVASVSVQPITLTYDIEIARGIYIDFDQNLGASLTVTYK